MIESFCIESPTSEQVESIQPFILSKDSAAFQMESAEIFMTQFVVKSENLEKVLEILQDLGLEQSTNSENFWTQPDLFDRLYVAAQMKIKSEGLFKQIFNQIKHNLTKVL